MPTVDILDSTWLHAGAATVGRVVGEARNWRRWWPSLRLRPTQLRGAQGVRWDVDRIGSGPARGLAGNAEIWLHPADDGVVVHFFLRLDPPPERIVDPRTLRRIEQYYRSATKRALWAVADELDPGRLTRMTGVPGRASAEDRVTPRAADGAASRHR